MLETGIKGTKTIAVTEENTAKAYGSGEMIPLQALPLKEQSRHDSKHHQRNHLLNNLQLHKRERTAVSLEADAVDVSHISATPIGMSVRCETKLIEVDRRRLVFAAEVYDDAGKIGEGTHERFLIQNESFLQKAKEK